MMITHTEEGTVYEDVDLPSIENSVEAELVELIFKKYNSVPHAMEEAWTEQTRPTRMAIKIELCKTFRVLGYSSKQISEITSISNPSAWWKRDILIDHGLSEATDVRQYIKDVRLKRAAQLIRDGMRIRPAAIKAGYTTTSGEEVLSTIIEANGGELEFIAKYA